MLEREQKLSTLASAAGIISAQEATRPLNYGEQETIKGLWDMIDEIKNGS